MKLELTSEQLQQQKQTEAVVHEENQWGTFDIVSTVVFTVFRNILYRD